MSNMKDICLICSPPVGYEPLAQTEVNQQIELGHERREED